MLMQILSHTPPWVFLLFAGLVVFGLVQARTRKVRKVPAYLLPIGMVALSLAGIHSSFGLEFIPVAIWAVGVIAVSFVGYRFFRDAGISFDSLQGTFVIPGRWSPLVVMMAIFFTKYVYAVVRALDSGGVDGPAVIMSLSLAYGGFSGYFAARAATLMSLAGRARASIHPSQAS